MYNKLFTKILDSSIWLEPTTTRIVWLTLIAGMDEDGFVALASVANLAHRARVTREEAEEAVKILEGPDPDSSDPEHEGRRIERSTGGWMVLNGPKYRDLVTRTVQREQTRARVAKHRAKKAGNDPVTQEKLSCNGGVTQSEAKADAEEKAEGEKRELRSCSETGEPSAEPPLMIFPIDGPKKEWFLTKARVSGYQESFPALDILQCCRAARQWCIDNPTKRKTHAGMPAFLGRWMAKAQDSREHLRLPLNGHRETEAQRDQRKTGLPPQTFNLKIL